MVLYNMINIWNHAQPDLFAMTVWVIWNQRNQIWHRIPSCNTDQLAQVAIERLNEFVAGLPPTNPAPQVQGSMEATPYWYVQTAVFKQENKSGVGIAIRDCKGEHYKKLYYCGGPKLPQKPIKALLKVHLTFSGRCYCGSTSRHYCGATIDLLWQEQKASQ